MSQNQSFGRQLTIRGHEVISHTATFKDGRYCCLVFLLDPFDEDRDLKVFKGYGPSLDEAETAGINTALEYLEKPQDAGASRLTDRSTVSIAGRTVDIFCDVVGERIFQAFPFLQAADGSRSIIMQFHLKEAITGESPAVAFNRCISRLEEYFGSLDRSHS